VPRRLALAGLSALLLACAAAPPRPFSGALPAFAMGERFIVAGDLQRTSWLERLAGRESNDPERARVVAAIAAERPAFLALTGDLVFDGASETQWADLDDLTAPLRRAAIPVYSALGNHEYWAGREGEAHFFARFPHLDHHHGYTLAHGPLRLVVLDSNRGEIDESDWQAEIAWYGATLAAFDADPAVRGVIVLLHHPPYTNSTVTGDEPDVQRDVVPPFSRARKTLVMHSGHVHSYERFARGSKLFVVSGGGGGPRARLAQGPARRHPDDLFAGPELRDFTFVLYAVLPGGIEAEVRGLPKGGEAFSTIDRFALPWPP
jgi:Calcineurin-like phosphoesterase